MPEKSERINMYLRIDSEVHGRVKADGENQNRTLNQQVQYILESWYDANALRARIAVLESEQ